METSKFIRSSLPLGNDMIHDFGRFSSEISGRSDMPNVLEETLLCIDVKKVGRQSNSLWEALVEYTLVCIASYFLVSETYGSKRKQHIGVFDISQQNAECYYHQQ